VKRERSRAIAVGLAAAGIIYLWQFLTVHYNYDGDWTALFRIGPIAPLPAFAAAEPHSAFPRSGAYDGQWYHLMAHDPWLQRGAVLAFDAPALRYRRILIPLLAWIVALGQDAWIDRAYFAVILGFVFAGAFWMARLAAHRGVNPAWGLMFAALPGTICSADSMTVDVALAALVAGFAWYAYTGSQAKLTMVLVCAALAREMALPLIGGYTLFLLWKHRFRDAVWAALSAAPALLWFAFVMYHTNQRPLRDFVSPVPMSGWLRRFFHPAVYPLPRSLNAIAVTLDYIALAGILWTFIDAFRMAWKPRAIDDDVAGVYSFGLFSAFLNGGQVWQSLSYGAGRILTPFLVITAIAELSSGPWLAFAPILLVDARLSLNLAPQLMGIVHGLLE
jgi:hypothetical protein